MFYDMTCALYKMILAHYWLYIGINTESHLLDIVYYVQMTLATNWIDAVKQQVIFLLFCIFVFLNDLEGRDVEIW